MQGLKCQDIIFLPFFEGKKKKKKKLVIFIAIIHSRKPREA